MSDLVGNPEEGFLTMRLILQLTYILHLYSHFCITARYKLSKTDFFSNIEALEMLKTQASKPESTLYGPDMTVHYLQGLGILCFS